MDLLKNSTMTLATTDLQGNPHAAPVYFVSLEQDQHLRLYYFSGEDSQHSQQINQNPKVAAAIYPKCQGWRDIKGLQLSGEAFLVESKVEWEVAWEQYQIKFPFVGSLKAAVIQNKMYVFIPSWIRLLDNSQGFGYKQEWMQE